MGQTTSRSYKFRRINRSLCKASLLAAGVDDLPGDPTRPPIAPEWYRDAVRGWEMPRNNAAVVLMTDISMCVQGWKTKMDSIVETTQVVAVLALLPIILVCLLIMEPFDHIRLRMPQWPRMRVARQKKATRTRPALESELA